MITQTQYLKRNAESRLLDDRNCHFIVEKTKAGNFRAYWSFRYQIDGKRRELTLKPKTLREDRALIAEWRSMLDDGLDPKLAKEARKQSLQLAKSFEEVGRECEAIRLLNSNAGRFAGKFIKRLETHVYPVIGKRPVDSIGRDDVLDVIQALWLEKNPTAQKILTDIGYILRYAVAEGLRDAPDPTVWKGNLEYKLASASKVHQVEHFAAMPFEQLPDFIAQLDKHDSLPALFVHFCILTCIRNGTVRKAKWSDIDLDNGRWIIPKGKNQKPFTVPLTHQMISVLKRVEEYRVSEVLFPQDRDPSKPVSENCGRSHMIKVWGIPDSVATMHGFRSTFATFMNEQPGLDRSMIDACIEHKVGDPIELAYNRSGWLAKRKEYMQIWNDYCWSEIDGIV